MTHAPHSARRTRAPLTLAVLAVLASPLASAVDFEKGELSGSWDTTVSYGASVRMEERDQDLIGKATINPLISRQNASFPAVPPLNALNGASGFPGTPSQNAAPGRYSVNRDDGNRKYDKGDLIANTAKITSEFSLKWRDWGLFTRATYFYDFENADRDDLTKEAQDLIGERFRWLDGFVYKDFHYGADDGLSGSMRLGRQVISWGEGTFIQNGINVINPIDLSALRVAGAELKEAYLPVDALWASFQVSPSVSLEGFYLKEWEEIEVDASGTYFSSNDHVGPGANYAMLSFGTVPQPVEDPTTYYSVCTGSSTGWSQSDRLPQYLALMEQAVPAATPNRAAVVQQQALALVAGGCSSSFRRSENRHARDSGQYGLALRWFAENLGNTEFGFYAMNYHSRLPIISGYANNGVPPGIAQLGSAGRPVPGASYFLEYPEDIRLFGISWNTSLPGGVAWQGEISHRIDAPFQVDDVELLIAGLTPLNNTALAAAPPSAKFRSQLGQFAPGQYIQGYREHDVSQLQTTFTKAFPQFLGADQLALVGELGATKVAGLESKRDMRYEAEGTDTGGGCDINAITSTMAQNPTTGAWTMLPPYNLISNGCLRNPLTQDITGFADAFSWGYRVAAVATYNSIFGGPINLSPRLAFNHDVHGTTPGPGGNFLEGRKSFTVGLEANWQQRLVFDLSYTGFNGAGSQNQISDRDFASFSVRYSF